MTSVTKPPPRCLQAAIALADLGYPVFPCVPGAKIPATKNGFWDATTDHEQIAAWFERDSEYNLAIATEWLFVLDVDPKGKAWLQTILPSNLRGAPFAKTPRGGLHFFYRQNGTKLGNTQGKIAEGVDTRANGGYVLVAPSVTEAGHYEWMMELDCPKDRLLEVPQWLLDELADKAPENGKPAAGGTIGQKIPEGQRNAELTRWAGLFRRKGLCAYEILAALRGMNKQRCTPPLPDKELQIIAKSVSRYEPDAAAVARIEQTIPAGTRVKALDRDNLGTVVSDCGDKCVVHFVNPTTGDEAEKELPKAKLTLADGRPLSAAGDAQPTAKIETIGHLIESHPTLRPAVIKGLLRRGETANIIADPKRGKSWLSYGLALSIVSGRDWLETYPVTAGHVLLLDNELHVQTIPYRIKTVAKEMDISPSEYEDRLQVLSLRGRLMDLIQIAPIVENIEPETFQAVITDSFYRMYPPGISENDNAQMASLYNRVDQYAEHTAASWVLIQHASKGNQSQKSVTDSGAGAGSQARATDCHLVLREHEEANHIVLEAAVRSFPPVKPIVLQWDFPLWKPRDGVDPSRLKNPKTQDQAKRDAEGIGLIEKALGDGPATVREIRRRLSAIKKGMGKDRAERLLGMLKADEKVIRRPVTIRGNETEEYAWIDDGETF